MPCCVACLRIDDGMDAVRTILLLRFPVFINGTFYVSDSMWEGDVAVGLGLIVIDRNERRAGVAV